MFFEKEFPSLKENQEFNFPLLITSWKDTKEEHFDCEEMAEEDEKKTLKDPEAEHSGSSDNYSDSLSLENSLPPAARQIKVIRPRHPTLINSDISESNILPHSSQKVTLLTEKELLIYTQALKSNYQKLWKEAIHKAIQSMLNL
ncbi:hypothetical protein O181_039787 [Austropuccinia psidii MF-1]|uniref:Uncharacterized protein n=1 Tax=Austropuccinia psidii MF-1 TaxID=1389203 RepID=A0A9Q3DHH1_9BASI|nr:hypothetical protein [Austropuccinia psidii MF-1]